TRWVPCRPRWGEHLAELRLPLRECWFKRKTRDHEQGRARRVYRATRSSHSRHAGLTPGLVSRGGGSAGAAPTDRVCAVQTGLVGERLRDRELAPGRLPPPV